MNKIWDGGVHTMEAWADGTGKNLVVHSMEQCEGQHCSVHNPSDHSMKDFPTHWRADRGIMERICPHGIGHPDPDDVAFYERGLRAAGIAEKDIEKKVRGYSVHGCDGCCK